jgi:hypothetical protein
MQYMVYRVGASKSSLSCLALFPIGIKIIARCSFPFTGKSWKCNETSDIDSIHTIDNYSELQVSDTINHQHIIYLIQAIQTCLNPPSSHPPLSRQTSQTVTVLPPRLS